MNILEVTGLQKNFSSQIAVNKLSFGLGQGSIFGLLGPNGAGKTTLIRMLTGIFYPDEGSILFEGRPFDPANDIVRIGYMPEERGLYKKMKIGEQALYLARLKGLSKQEALRKVKEWFIKFEMQSWWNKKVEDLSKGMQQKLQFVITVLHEPKLIILDEPFSGLDPVNSNLIKDEIYGLARRGASIIFSTHRMEQVEEICDHIILVNKGQKILDGTVSGVKQQFKENLFSVGLEAAEGRAAGNGAADPWKAGAAAFEVVGQKEGHWIVKIREGFRPNDVLRYFIDQGKGVTSFMEILPSLNDIFIRLVEGTPLARQFEPVNL
ncbi:MAG TPA: ATP-binding cassette domain-containing protein [Puia sp.]|jgi:ABC-2 type transport system ATP-binding protein|nr:ATP-binding cassette domain-containing protein [Puia sp.]